jgi:hypothetical protein
MHAWRDRVGAAVVLGGLLLMGATLCDALTLSGRVDQKSLVTSGVVSSVTPTLLKLRFENRTSGTNLSLCSGTEQEFSEGSCPMQFSSSGGAGSAFLTLVSTAELGGKKIWVKNNGPVRPAIFTLTVE